MKNSLIVTLETTWSNLRLVIDEYKKLDKNKPVACATDIIKEINMSEDIIDVHTNSRRNCSKLYSYGSFCRFNQWHH
jgi:hypothetical protein